MDQAIEDSIGYGGIAYVIVPAFNGQLADVVYSFGRHDQLDIDAPKGRVKSLWRYVCPEDPRGL